jgi:hypothetical protein
LPVAETVGLYLYTTLLTLLKAAGLGKLYQSMGSVVASANIAAEYAKMYSAIQ